MNYNKTKCAQGVTQIPKTRANLLVVIGHLHWSPFLSSDLVEDSLQTKQINIHNIRLEYELVSS